MPKPDSINLGFSIDLNKLWKLEISPEEIDIQELENNLIIPYLETEGTDDWNLSPGELILSINREISHKEKIEKCDTNYPIDIYFYKNNWIILDWVHRYVKHLLLGEKSVQVRKIPEDLIQTIRRK